MGIFGSITVDESEPMKVQRFSSSRGLALALAGAPTQEVHADQPTRHTKHVALCGLDYPGLKPRVLIKPGDTVRAGQALFFDKRDPAVMYTAPGSGTILAIHRGQRRQLESIIIRLADEDERPLFANSLPSAPIEAMSREEVIHTLAISGLWTAFRRRPFGRVPHSEEQPSAIFITAMDTEPLAADPAVAIGFVMDSFRMGLRVLTRLTSGNLWLCTAAGWTLGEPDIERVHHAVFEGPHPAGLAGTHIHQLAPVNPHRVVWHIGYADVIAIGKLFGEGVVDFQRIVALGGEPLLQPRLVRTRLGVSLDELLDGEIAADHSVRIVSGSLLSGRAQPADQRFLGRYHLQVSLVPEGNHRKRSNGLWRRLGSNRLSNPTTTLHGSPSGMLSLEAFERALPAGFLAVPLLRALMSGDIEQAQALGCLELDEEDLALCAYLCPAKCDYGGALRSALAHIEREG